ncbi:MAG: hypothetical protein RR333_08350, partial [Bacteroidales bacterium]
MKKFMFFSMLMALCFSLHAQQDSRNGSEMPTKGSLKVLVVFAEVTSDPYYNDPTGTWQSGHLPPDAGKIFDLTCPNCPMIHSSSSESLIGANGGYIPGIQNNGMVNFVSKFFYQSSLEKLVMTGDYYPRLIQVPITAVALDNLDGKLDGVQPVLDSLAKYIAQGQNRSSAGFRIPEDFDLWNLNGEEYYPKTKQADGKIDQLVIIWRVNSTLSTMYNSGFSTGFVSSKTGNFKANLCSSQLSYDFLNTAILYHEISHNLLGGNQYHNGGAGAGIGKFLSNIGGYGILESYNNNLTFANGWDRRRLGWDTLHVQQENRTVSGDLDYFDLSNTYAYTFTLRDFEKKGDALRIKLPYLREDNPETEEQWLWIENHVMDDPNMISYTPTRPSGIRFNIQIGNEDFNNASSRTNYYIPLNRFGNFDYSVVKEMFLKSVHTPVSLFVPYPSVGDSLHLDEMTKNESSTYRAYLSTNRSNPFTGYSLSQNPAIDFNSNGFIQDENTIIKTVYLNGDPLPYQYPIFGNEYDVFHSGDQLNLSTNPATTPVITHNRSGMNTTFSENDNRKVYLNGLSVQILNKAANGDITLSVRRGYQQIANDVRWCGDIVLKENLQLFTGKKITLSVGSSPITAKDPILINGIYVFSVPTILECRNQSSLFLYKNAEIEVENLCALVLKSGSDISTSTRSSDKATIHVKSGGTLIIEPNVSLSNNIIWQLDTGAFLCASSNVIPNIGP